MNNFFNKCKRNVVLSVYTTFKIGGPADYFFVAKNQEDLIEALKAAKDEGIKYYILGGGSNVLVADEGFRGLVIEIKNQKSKIKITPDMKSGQANKKSKIELEAGVSLGSLVSLALKNSLTGVEFWSGVPGTIGGAIFGNAGAYGKDCQNVLRSVTYYDVVENKIIKKEIKELKFSYRSSEFKLDKNKIILSCEIELKKGNKDEITAKMTDIAKKRAVKIPMEPSAGSVFKNVTTNLIQILDKLDTDDTNKERFRKFRKIPAAVLIEECGLKGRQIGGAKISEKHANFIINMSGAKAKDVLELIKLAKNKVKARFGVKLELENILVGF